MKIIDILDKMAEGTLEDGFKFEFRGETYTYNKEKDKLEDTEGYTISSTFQTEYLLTDEVEVIEDVKKIKEIKEITAIKNDFTGLQALMNKINELVQTVNKLRREKGND